MSEKTQSNTYSVIPGKLIDAKPGVYEISVYVFIMSRTNLNSDYEGSLDEIAKELGISRTTTRKAIKNLVEGNNFLGISFLEKEERYRSDGGRDINKYTSVSEIGVVR